MWQLNLRFQAYSILLLLIEVFIAAFVNDSIIRPYGGDFLVVMLIYYAVKSFLKPASIPTALFVLLFAYLMETLQYFCIVERLGLINFYLAQIIIGSSFSWIDIVAYSLGILTVIFLERGNVK